MPLAHNCLLPEHEKMLWEKRELNMDTSKGLSKAVIFYLIKCFALWQGKELRQLDTSQVTFSEDDLGSYVALDLQKFIQRQKKTVKRYDDPANPRSVYKIFKKYRGYVANEGPFLVRPITSIKDYICYSPLPLGVNVIESTVFTLMKETGQGVRFVNYSLNLQAVNTLLRFGTGSHCLASWLFKNGLKGMPPCDECGPTNCEDFNPEIALMISRLLDAPHPLDAVEMIQKMERLDDESNFHSWMTNLMSQKRLEAIAAHQLCENDTDGNDSSDIERQLEAEAVGSDNTVQSKKKSLRKSSVSKSSTSHCLQVTPCLSPSPESSCKLKISNVSSISEGAFSMQEDEVSINKSSSSNVKRKRKRMDNSARSLVKKSKPSHEKEKSSPICFVDSQSIKEEIEEDDGGESFGGNSACETVEKVKGSDERNFHVEIIKIKEEVKDDDTTTTQQDSSQDVCSDSVNKAVDGSCQAPLPARMARERKTAQVEKRRRCNDRVNREGLPVGKVTTSTHPSEKLLKGSSSPTVSSSSSNHPPAKDRSCRRKSACDQESVMQKVEQQLRDSIAVLRELRHSSRPKDSSDTKDSPQTSCEEVHVEEGHSHNPHIPPDSEDVSDDNMADGQDNDDLMIDLSPPVLSPQCSLSPPKDNEDDRIELQGSDTPDTVESGVLSDEQSSTAPKSTFLSTSEIITFLNNANKHIEGLLKSSENIVSCPGEMPESRICASKNKPDTSNKVALSSTTNKAKPNGQLSDNAPLVIGRKGSTASTTSNVMTPPSSTDSCGNNKQKTSLLRSYLEKPKESVQAPTFPLPSSANVSASKANSTSLLPKPLLSESKTNVSPPSKVVNALGPSISTKDLSSCRNEDLPVSDSCIIPSPQLPVKIILNTTSSLTSSSSSFSSLSSSPSSSSSPFTVVLQSASSVQPSVVALPPASSSLKPPTSTSASSSSLTSSLLSSSSSTTSSSSRSPTAIVKSTTTESSNLAVYEARQDATVSALYQTLKIVRPDSQGGIQTHNFADIPNVMTRSPQKTAQTHSGKAGCTQTSEINLGDYFPPGTLIPASSIHILTQQAEQGSEVVLKFGFTRNSPS